MMMMDAADPHDIDVTGVLPRVPVMCVRRMSSFIRRA
jgi:hypothetical protein